MSVALVSLVIVKGTFAAALALAATWAARRARASARHVMLTSAFAALLAIPLVSMVAPTITVPVPVTQTSLAAPVVDALDVTAIDAGAEVAAASQPTPALPAPARRPIAATSIALLLWLAGVFLTALPLVVGLWQMRRLRRHALPWRDGQPIVDRLAADAGIRQHVLVAHHDAISGPMTCGVIAPVVLLPLEAASWPQRALTSALIHELEHVRRADWATQIITRVVASLYWFHPLVWVMRRQLVLEAERACDDAVLRSAEATAYADQLVDLARQLSASARQPLLAMANRADLTARVRAVLDLSQPRGRAGARTVIVGATLAVIVVLALSPLRVVAARNDATVLLQDGPRFDVVSIRPCADDTPPPGVSGARSGQGGFPEVGPGRFTIECGTVERLISTAYVLNGEALTNNTPRIGDVSWWKGGPGWLRTDKFTIEATAQGVTDRKVMLGPMLRAVLEDRFKVKLHRETADVPMYEMHVAKNGLKMTPESCDARDQDAQPTREAMTARMAAVEAGTVAPQCGHMTMLGSPGTSKWIIGGETIPGFAGTLSSFMDRRVLDKTGLDPKTQYNVRLQFRRDEHIPGPDKRFGPPTSIPEGDGPTIFQALEQQLGLTLESSKGPQGFLVIDRVEKPTPNSTAPSRVGGPGPSSPLESAARALTHAAQSALVAIDTAQTSGAAGHLPVQHFDAVSIKPCSGDPQLQPGTGGGRGSIGTPVASPGRIAMDCGTVERLIKLAYITNGERLLHNNAAMAPVRPAGYGSIPGDPADIVDTWWKGAPSWIRDEKFSIEATAPGVTDRAVLLGPMLRGLLEDRFQLRMHRDQVEAPLYRMVVAKSGFKGAAAPCSRYDDTALKTSDDFRKWNETRWSGGVYECGIVSTINGWVLGGQTMDDIATKVMPLLYVDRFVVDETGLTGKYNARVTVRGSDGGTVDAFTAVEQWLGLKLEPTRGPQGILVIDRIERPSSSTGARGAGPRL